MCVVCFLFFFLCFFVVFVVFVCVVFFFFFKQRAAYEVSACLVGSVMCIRGGCVCTCVRGCVCCRLYTSDAADDLLCVGLGGRRIIKKKINVDMSVFAYDAIAVYTHWCSCMTGM